MKDGHDTTAGRMPEFLGIRGVFRIDEAGVAKGTNRPGEEPAEAGRAGVAELPAPPDRALGEISMEL